MNGCNCDILFHPELLPNETLLSILLERQVKIPNMHDLPREALIEVFHQYCVPFSQRKYKDSGRGKVLNKRRGIQEESPNLQTELTVDNLYINNKSTDRLKPPPQDLQSKKIKLSCTNGIRNVTKDINGASKRKIPFDLVSIDFLTTKKACTNILQLHPEEIQSSKC